MGVDYFPHQEAQTLPNTITIVHRLYCPNQVCVANPLADEVSL